MDGLSISQLAGFFGGAVASVLTAQQLYRKFKATNSDIEVDTQISNGTIEIIRLLREQNEIAKAASQESDNRYMELQAHNDSLYEIIRELQLRINKLTSEIGEHQIDNKNLRSEVENMRKTNGILTEQVAKLTAEVQKLRKGVG